MYAFRTFLTLLAFSLVSVSAAPFHNHHKRTCRTPTSVPVVPTTTTAVADHTSTVSVVPTIGSKPETTSSPLPEKAESSSTHEATSTQKASTTSSSKPAATSPSSSDDGDDDKSSASTSILKKLFPVNYIKTWTTSKSADDALPLSDSTFGVTKLISSLSHDYVSAPDGKLSMQAHYPKGSYTYTHSPQGGLSFYATGPDNFNLENAKEATLSYSVYFDEDFDFNKGGKLPGLYGGNSEDIATSCSGGRRDDRCFSTRFMWRTDGKGELYTYLPSSYQANKAVCNVAPESDCNDTYGASVGRGSFNFKAGTRTTIGQRVKLNDVGKENGELELFVEGKSIFTVNGLVFRNSDSGKIRGIQMQTFFGACTQPHHCITLAHTHTSRTYALMHI
ncbi:hypothetical protein C8Q80DRAFT_292160 [Daedaleopsis nitida]|nr:hypothetical protein C8Q80DRAFT_292160 [Daedaleopsis nitida]